MGELPNLEIDDLGMVWYFVASMAKWITLVLRCVWLRSGRACVIKRRLGMGCCWLAGWLRWVDGRWWFVRSFARLLGRRQEEKGAHWPLEAAYAVPFRCSSQSFCFFLSVSFPLLVSSSSGSFGPLFLGLIVFLLVVYVVLHATYTHASFTLC